MSTNTIRVIKFIALLLGGFIAFIFAAAFIVDNEFETERSIIIDKPVDVVFEHIRYLRNQNNYSVWVQRDPDLRIEYRGTDGEVGAVSAWEGNEEAGAGEQEIVAISEGERIDFELRFFEPFESSSNAFKTTEAVSENQTRVTWGMYGTMPRPLNLMLLFMNLEEAIGNDYEIGLQNLKMILEESSSAEADGN